VIFSVYAFKAGTIVVYVGMTERPVEARAAAHRHSSPWWDPTLTVETLSFYDNSTAAWKAERAAIAKYRPMFNITGNPDKRKERAA
jgi:nitrate reductase alpha subunit